MISGYRVYDIYDDHHEQDVDRRPRQQKCENGYIPFLRFCRFFTKNY